jgi:hypothetical protein
MPTILTRMSSPHPASAGIPPIDVDFAEPTIFRHPALRNWWRADAGYSPGGWLCRRTGAVLAPHAASPERVTLAAYNNRPSLRFVAADDLNCAGVHPTTGRYTFVVVGRPGPGDNAYLFGSAHATDYARLQIVGATTGAIAYRVHPSPNLSIGAGGATGYFEGGPYLFTISHAPDQGATGELTMRINRGVLANTLMTTNATTLPPDNTLRVGAAGPVDAPQGPINGGEIAEVLVFATALHLDTGLRDIVEAYLGRRYGFAAP